MKIGFVCAAALALSLAACSGNQSSTTSTSSAAPEASAMGAASAMSSTMAPESMGKMNANTVTIPMRAQNGSGESGTATLTAMGAKTRVNIGLTGENATGKQPAHIHMGSCAKLNPAPKYLLKDVVLGKSNTVLEVPIGMLTKGTMAINVHESAKNLPKYVSCGNIMKM